MDLIGLQEVRGEKGGVEPANNCNGNMYYNFVLMDRVLPASYLGKLVSI
jgi:hypothetical protein